MNSVKILFFALATMMIVPCSTEAATLYLDPPSLTVGPEDVFEVKVKLGTGAGECINAANVSLNFPADVLAVKDFNIGDSIFSLWIDKPGQESLSKINAEGKISFSGGLPGGYCGKISGDPGDSNILGSVIFTPKKPILFHKGGVDFGVETQIYLNDGQGTVAKMELQGMNAEIDENASAVRDDWSQRIVEDKFPPEPFMIEISRDEKVADGRYFIVFFTTDKQTGVDHYEVLEARPGDLVDNGRGSLLPFLKGRMGKSGGSSVSFERASSPYVLKDQELDSVIKVKAVDKAGNERVIEYHNDAFDRLTKMQNRRPVWPLAAGIALSFVAVAAIWMTVSRMKRR